MKHPTAQGSKPTVRPRRPHKAGSTTAPAQQRRPHTPPVCREPPTHRRHPLEPQPATDGVAGLYTGRGPRVCLEQHCDKQKRTRVGPKTGGVPHTHLPASSSAAARQWGNCTRRIASGSPKSAPSQRAKTGYVGRPPTRNTAARAAQCHGTSAGRGRAAGQSAHGAEEHRRRQPHAARRTAPARERVAATPPSRVGDVAGPAAATMRRNWVGGRPAALPRAATAPAHPHPLSPTAALTRTIWWRIPPLLPRSLAGGAHAGRVCRRQPGSNSDARGVRSEGRLTGGQRRTREAAQIDDRCGEEIVRGGVCHHHQLTVHPLFQEARRRGWSSEGPTLSPNPQIRTRRAGRADTRAAAGSSGIPEPDAQPHGRPDVCRRGHTGPESSLKRASPPRNPADHLVPPPSLEPFAARRGTKRARSTELALLNPTGELGRGSHLAVWAASLSGAPGDSCHRQPSGASTPAGPAPSKKRPVSRVAQLVRAAEPVHPMFSVANNQFLN